MTVLVDRDIYIRNHVLGVLVSNSGKTLGADLIGSLARGITEAAMMGEDNWRQERCTEEVALYDMDSPL